MKKFWTFRLTGPGSIRFTVESAVGPFLVEHGGAGRVTVWSARASLDEVQAVVEMFRDLGLKVQVHASGTAETVQVSGEAPSE